MYKPIDELENERYRLEAAVNNALLAVAKFKKEHPEMRNGVYLNLPGSWLNAYREGDISFHEAIELIERHQKREK